MKAARTRTLVLASVVATLGLGLAAMPAAWAATSLTVTPSTGLTDGQAISIELDGFTPGPLTSVQVAECGNAFGNGTALPSMPSATPGVLDSVNCEVIGFLSEGNVTTSPVTISGPQVTARQTAVGTGNRSCISAPPAIAPCFVYVSTSVNLPPFPQTDLTFANDLPISGGTAATTTTVTPLGSPVGLGKTVHALVQVATADPTLIPEGLVQVFEGATSLGNGSLVGGKASVAIGTPALGLHDLTASFTGNGSFDASDSSISTLSVIDAKNISIGDASIVEGDSTNGTRGIAFPVVLSMASTSLPVSVNYSVIPIGGASAATVGATATTPNADVVAMAKTLTFKPGKATIKYITVKVVGDTVDEGNQTFAVQLTNNANNGGYVLRRATGNGLIIDDDSPAASVPTVGIGEASVNEGDTGGAHAMKFAVTLSGPASAPLTVNVQVSSLTAQHGTKLDGDWGGGINRRVVFKTGQISRVLGIAAFPELKSEGDESVKLTVMSIVTADTNVVIGSHSVAIGTILSDE